MQSGQFAAMLGPGRSDVGREIARTELLLHQEGLTPEQEGFCRHRLGLALYEVGDLKQAEQQLHRLLALGGERPALAELQADAFYCLGQIHRLFRRTDLEVSHFQDASRRYTALGMMDKAVLCHREAAWSLLLAKDAARALPELEKAMAGLKGVALPDLAVAVGIAEALWLSLIGKPGCSDQRCLTLLDHPPLQPVQRAEIAWLLGCNALAGGDLTAAEIHASIAHEYAMLAWWPPLMVQVNQLRREIRGQG